MLMPWILGIVSLVFLLIFQAKGIYAGDSGDLVTAAYTFGVPHPSGYPLYTFLGWLVTRVQMVSPAWQVTLVSSIPQAFSVLLVAGMVFRLTKSLRTTVFSSILLMGNYVFFLYGVIAEVYGLANVLLLALLFALFLWADTKNRIWVYAASLLFGLGLSHHHVVLFFPAIVLPWWFFARRTAAPPRLTIPVILRCIGLVGVGLLPYIYVWIAAAGSSIINWDHVTTLERFTRLFMLTDYGSFKANVGVGEAPFERILGLKAFVQFFLNDFSWPGIILLLVGFAYLYKTRRSAFWLLLFSYLVFGPLLYFYASFPIVSRFTLGTFEQFLLFSHTLAALVISVGFFGILEGVRVVGRKYFGRILSVGTGVVLLIYPLVLFGINIYRFTGFSGDLTAQNLGEDILRTAKPKSIVFLYGDTSLFTTQYVRYTLGRYPGIVVLQGSRVASLEYQETLKKVFPKLNLPSSASDTSYVAEFVGLQRADYPIYSNSPFPVDEESYWVPVGLLYRLTEAGDLPQITALRQENEAMWKTYQKPHQGILSHFNHLLLSDVRDVYASAKIKYGKTLLKGGDAAAARGVFQDAISYQSDIFQSDAYIFAGVSAVNLGECQEALDMLKLARLDPSSEPTASYYEWIVWKDCFKDPKRAEKAFNEYERVRKTSEQPLEAL